MSASGPEGMGTGEARAGEQPVRVRPRLGDLPPALRRRSAAPTGRTRRSASRALAPSAATRPAAAAHSSRKIAYSEPWPSRRASASTSRAPSPPVRSNRCGAASRVCTTRSRSASSSTTAPAAARSVRPGSCGGAATGGGPVGTGSAVKRLPRRNQATSRGTITVPESAGRSSSSASSSSMGERAPAAGTVRSALRTAPLGCQRSRSSTARAASLHSGERVGDLRLAERSGRRRRQTAGVWLERLPDRADQMQRARRVPRPERWPEAHRPRGPRCPAARPADPPARSPSQGRAARPSPRRWCAARG